MSSIDDTSRNHTERKGSGGGLAAGENRESKSSAASTTPTRKKKKETHKLGEWSATAICGNDITSSVLYVSALCIAAAGYLAPISLGIVVLVLYFYRKIYAEVGSALPLNGGAYNCLLNSTTKFWASVAACMTIVSYIATAVISAKTAVSYVASVAGFEHDIKLILGITIGVLGTFAVLTIIGIGESARVALAIFIFHMTTLVVFVAIAGYTVITNPHVLIDNFHQPLPDGHGVVGAIFFGFAAALLGISGFESSANFIEEQAPGVFVKTLRNMWVAVSIFNPLVAVLALGVISPDGFRTLNPDNLLSTMAKTMSGDWLAIWVSVNAALVLCGAVLTSFVGVTGLVRRMTLDRCLPQFLLKENRRGTSHRIIIAFFLLSSSILLLTGGRVETLAGLYAIAFLGVMSLFAIGNILLKVRRSRLRREYRASVPIVLIALSATVTGLIGNIAHDVNRFWFFLSYFVPTVFVVGIMFWRTQILKLFLYVVQSVVSNIDSRAAKLISKTDEMIETINNSGVIFFTKGDSVVNLNLAMLYVRSNEDTKNIKVIHIRKPGEEVPERLATDIKLLDEIYPELNIELILREGEFGPEIIEELSEEFNIPKNYMFIGAPGERFPHNLSDLGGVRLII